MRICGNTLCDFFNPDFKEYCSASMTDRSFLDACNNSTIIDILLPEIIFLQIEDDSGNIRGVMDATWCAEKIYDTDIKYKLINI